MKSKSKNAGGDTVLSYAPTKLSKGFWKETYKALDRKLSSEEASFVREMYARDVAGKPITDACISASLLFPQIHDSAGKSLVVTVESLCVDGYGSADEPQAIRFETVIAPEVVAFKGKAVVA